MATPRLLRASELDLAGKSWLGASGQATITASAVETQNDRVRDAGDLLSFPLSLEAVYLKSIVGRRTLFYKR